jgi:site-specific recombinase XerD
MPDYALELVDGHLRPQRHPDPAILVSSAHGIQQVVKLIVTQAAEVPPDPSDLEAEMRKLQLQILMTKASSTLRAYLTDLRDFNAYCHAQGSTALPAAPETIAHYLASLVERGYKPSTILRRRASIARAHRLAGHRFSEVADTFVRPLLGSLRQQVRFSAKKPALDVTSLRRMLRGAPRRTAAGARDRLMLLLGFAGGLRASELVALDVRDIHVTDQRLWLLLPDARTGSWYVAREVTIPRGEHPETCSVRAIRAWYAISGIRTGALFRPIDRHRRVGATRLSARAVALVIKRAAQRADLDPTQYAGHSLRAGFVTAAVAGGAPERVILAQTGLHSLSGVPRYLRRRRSRSDRDAAAYVGL